MKHRILTLMSTTIIVCNVSSFAFAQTGQPVPQLGKNSIKEVVAAMTTEEKARLVVGNGMKMPGGQGPVIGQTQDKVAGAAGTTAPIPRLGIPSIVLADGPAGVRIDPIRNKDSSKTYYATAWPVATLLASSWDTAMVKKLGVAFGREVHDYGIDIILAPGLNIQRNPLGGRNFEYYSEDPLLTGSMTSAIVNGIETNGVGTSIKHFAVNNQETNRNTVNTIVSERALREIYLRAFEIAVKRSQPWTVMSSYNRLNGTYTSEEYGLLTSILRKDWGFKGLVMTDWFGGKDPVAQMRAGNDLLMPGTPALAAKIMSAVKQDSLATAVLDENAARILNIIVQSPSFKQYKFSDKPDLKANAATSRMAAVEGMILLKNNNALPLKNVKKVALYGNTSYDIIAGGTGSGDVNKLYTISLIRGLTNAGFSADGELNNQYATYLKEQKAKNPKKSFFEEFMNPTPPIPELTLAADLVDRKSSEADVAVITIGRNAGENFDRKVPNDFNLSETELLMIKSISTAFHKKNKKVVVVLNIGGVIEVASWRDQVDAILLAWQPGLEAGNAITDLLRGRVNPSGKLAITFPVKYSDVPSANNFPGKEYPEQATGQGFFRQVPAEVTYEDGIYVGYRYYNTFNVKTAYEFGYGLSYTNFSYGNISLSSKTFNGKVTATLNITNTGKVAGKEVVQLYLGAPASTLDKPSAELKAFAKTSLLQPGESEKISFTLDARDLASFDTGSSSWVADAGRYTVSIGSSSLNIKQAGTFELNKKIDVEKVSKVVVPQIAINELKPPKR